ncbi:MAG: BatA and WFA domain-containing protein [Bacteroidales bacterium]|nr:BatA and WFA domain-containing protein [Bacteroidales bacterium]
MNFLHPSILWALTALLIPIIIHLFNFRRHKLVYFSNTAVLKTIEQESARTKKLKYLVLLFLRCLFIAALVMAFAYPYRPDEVTKINPEEGVVGVYVDNSMSMRALSDKTTLLEDAREEARDMVNGFPPSTRYLLLTNSFEVENEYPMSQEEMLDRLDRMHLEGAPVKLNEVIDRFAMLRKMHGFDKATLVAYSDFQENMLDLTGIAPDTTLLVVAVPMRASSQANISVDTVWLGSPVVQPEMANDLHAVVTNRGDREMKGLPINLNMDGKMVASATVDVEAGGSAEVVMQVVPERSGDIPCAVTLMDYPVTFDDTYRFVIGVKSKLSVVELTVDKQPTPVALVFSDDPQFDYVAMAPNGFDLEVLGQAQLVVVSESSALNETVRGFLLDEAEEGASVVFFHDDGAVIDTNAVPVSDLAVQHAFFNDIIIDLPQHADLPQANRHVRLTPTPGTTTLMHLGNGDPMLVEQPVGKGHVYDFATLLDDRWSNLAENPIFVPLMLKMAFLGGGVGKMAYTLGVDKVPDELPELGEAGFYELTQTDSVRHLMAWNDSRLESDLKAADDATIERLFKDAGMEMTASTDTQKSTLWRWLVLLALVAVLGEIAVLRFWK